MMNGQKNIPDLPSSNDKEFWDGEVIHNTPHSINICSTHGRNNYMEHKGYKDMHDGTIACVFCPWGALLNGNLRVIDGRLKTIVG